MKRQYFLAASAAGAAAVNAVPAFAAAPATASVGVSPKFVFDRAAFEAQLNRPVRHRQVFASTALEDGQVLRYMENSIAAYADGFGEGPGTLHAAAVLYGASIALACDDTIWTKYNVRAVLGAFPKPEKISAPDAPGNPFAARVALLASGGASFFVCNNALHGVAAFFAAKNDVLPADSAGNRAVYDDLAAHLWYATLVPAGVAALNAAQEARFTLIQATLS